MTDFFLWRGCDISQTGAREAIKRNRDFIDRAGATLEAESGLPADPTLPTDPGTTPCSALDVVSAEWVNLSNTGLGTLDPGTYSYRLIPIDTCTGRTCEPIELPPLVIATLGQQATLAITLGTPPTSCDSYMLQRDGVVVGPIIPATRAMLSTFNLTVPSDPLDGNFINGTDRNFDMSPGGADLQAGDLIAYYNPNPFPADPKVVRVVSVAGSTVTFEPRITLEPVQQSNDFFDILQRTALYGGAQYAAMPLSSPGLIPPYPNGFPGFPFSVVVPGGGSPGAGLFGVPHFGDVVSYGSKTALVMGVFPGTNGIPDPGAVLVQVALLPLGLLPPPMPVGLMQLVYRPDPPIGVNSGFGLFGTPRPGDPDPASFERPNFLVQGDGSAPLDPNLQVGRQVLFTTGDPLVPIGMGRIDLVTTESATLSRIHLSKNELSDPQPQNSPPGGYSTGDRYLVGATPTSPLSWLSQVGKIAEYNGSSWDFEDPVPESMSPGSALPAPANSFPFPGATPDPELMADTGIYFMLPNGLSQFLPVASLNATGTYSRLTRTTTQYAQANLLTLLETGANQVRSGLIGGDLAGEARTTLDQMLTQGGYPEGLTAFRNRVLGPCPTPGSLSLASKTFNETLGGFTLPAGGLRFYAVNTTAQIGPGPLVNVERVRAIRTLVCDSMQNVQTLTDQLNILGVAIMRFKVVTSTLPPEKCPPGQPNMTVETLVCNGLATIAQPLLSDEQARVFWGPNRRFAVNAKKMLTERGLTEDEAQAALELTTNGRVLHVIELSDRDITDATDLVGIDDGDIVDDDRIDLIDLGPIVPPQVAAILRRRGIGGIVNRPVCTEPDQTAQVEDFETVATNLLGLALQYPLSFQVCDVDAALAALPPEARDVVAGVLAVIDAGLVGLETFGAQLRAFLNDGPYADAKEFLAGIINAISSDPTLGCLFGSINAQAPNYSLPSIPMLEGLQAQLAVPLTVRFNLLGLVMEAIRSVVCILINALLSLIPEPVANAARIAISCIPPLDSLSLPLELELVLQCDLSRLSIIIDIINQVIAEINEILDFLSLGQGFFKNVQARNQACSSDENLAGLVRRAAEALGIPDTAGTVANAAANAATAASGAVDAAASLLGGI